MLGCVLLLLLLLLLFMIIIVFHIRFVFVDVEERQCLIGQEEPKSIFHPSPNGFSLMVFLLFLLFIDDLLFPPCFLVAIKQTTDKTTTKKTVRTKTEEHNLNRIRIQMRIA